MLVNASQSGLGATLIKKEQSVCFGEFTLSLFTTRLVTEAGKFELPIGRLSESTNRQPELSSFGHQSRAKIC